MPAAHLTLKCLHCAAMQMPTKNVQKARRANGALLKGYVQDNSMDEGAMQKRDWLSMVDNTKESYMEAKLYKGLIE